MEPTDRTVVELYKRAVQDAMVRRALERLKQDPSRARGDVHEMDRSAFAVHVLEHPDSKVSAPVALVWSRPEIETLEKVARLRNDSPTNALSRAAAAYLMNGEVALAGREGRVHVGIRGESEADVAREVRAKIALAIRIQEAEKAIAECACGTWGDAENALLTALQRTTPAWPYDRLAGWKELDRAMRILAGQYDPVGTEFRKVFAWVEYWDAQLRLLVAEARANHVGAVSRPASA